MTRQRFLATAAGSLAGAGLLSACGADPASRTDAGEGSLAGPPVQWRLASSYPPSLDILHGGAERLAERVRILTGGRFDIRVYPAGELVPGLQVMDAVEAGTVHAGFTAGYFYIGKHPALAFDTAVPFGLTPRQRFAWLHHAGGTDLLREVYADFGIIHFPFGTTGPQMGGWFRRPLASLADLRGLRMRIPGLAGEILSRLGVSVQVLAGGDIFPALERGAIDATEWVGPYDDEKLGFYQIAPYYYQPGWWEPGATTTLQVGRRAWDDLPRAYREALGSAVREVSSDMLARYDVANPRALERLVGEHGVELRSFPDAILEAAWDESEALLEEQSAADATFRRIHESWSAFRRTAFRYSAGNELEYARFAFQAAGLSAIRP
ncbi:MAG: ABC transporter substrate-binding protein [Gemmatimonadetes bacterium]|nr:ABC transporter substrate-binding protein [Gemmatimonadota bacterium]